MSRLAPRSFKLKKVHFHIFALEADPKLCEPFMKWSSAKGVRLVDDGFRLCAFASIVSFDPATGAQARRTGQCMPNQSPQSHLTGKVAGAAAGRGDLYYLAAPPEPPRSTA